jgi:hypothetical protein
VLNKLGVHTRMGDDRRRSMGAFSGSWESMPAAATIFSHRRHDTKAYGALAETARAASARSEASTEVSTQSTFGTNGTHDQCANDLGRRSDNQTLLLARRLPAGFNELRPRARILSGTGEREVPCRDACYGFRIGRGKHEFGDGVDIAESFDDARRDLLQRSRHRVRSGLFAHGAATVRLHLA